MQGSNKSILKMIMKFDSKKFDYGVVNHTKDKLIVNYKDLM